MARTYQAITGGDFLVHKNPQTMRRMSSAVCRITGEFTGRSNLQDPAGYPVAKVSERVYSLLLAGQEFSCDGFLIQGPTMVNLVAGEESSPARPFLVLTREQGGAVLNENAIPNDLNGNPFDIGILKSRFPDCKWTTEAQGEETPAVPPLDRVNLDYYVNARADMMVPDGAAFFDNALTTQGVYCNITDKSKLDCGMNHFAVSVWVDFLDDVSYRTIISTGAGNPSFPGFWLSKQGGDWITLALSDGATNETYLFGENRFRGPSYGHILLTVNRTTNEAKVYANNLWMGTHDISNITGAIDAFIASGAIGAYNDGNPRHVMYGYIWGLNFFQVPPSGNIDAIFNNTVRQWLAQKPRTVGEIMPKYSLGSYLHANWLDFHKDTPEGGYISNLVGDNPTVVANDPASSAIPLNKVKAPLTNFYGPPFRALITGDNYTEAEEYDARKYDADEGEWYLTIPDAPKTWEFTQAGTGTIFTIAAKLRTTQTPGASLYAIEQPGGTRFICALCQFSPPYEMGYFEGTKWKVNTEGARLIDDGEYHWYIWAINDVTLAMFIDETELTVSDASAPSVPADDVNTRVFSTDEYSRIFQNTICDVNRFVIYEAALNAAQVANLVNTGNAGIDPVGDYQFFDKITTGQEGVPIYLDGADLSHVVDEENNQLFVQEDRTLQPVYNHARGTIDFPINSYLRRAGQDLFATAQFTLAGVFDPDASDEQVVFSSSDESAANKFLQLEFITDLIKWATNNSGTTGDVTSDSAQLPAKAAYLLKYDGAEWTFYKNKEVIASTVIGAPVSFDSITGRDALVLGRLLTA